MVSEERGIAAVRLGKFSAVMNFTFRYAYEEVRMFSYYDSSSTTMGVVGEAPWRFRSRNRPTEREELLTVGMLTD